MAAARLLTYGSSQSADPQHEFAPCCLSAAKDCRDAVAVNLHVALDTLS
jgi:hypothetical protein